MVGRRRAAAARTIGGFRARERAGPRDERNRRGTARRPRAARALRRRLATVDALEAARLGRCARSRSVRHVPAAAARLRSRRGARRVLYQGQRRRPFSAVDRRSLVRRRRIARAIRPSSCCGTLSIRRRRAGRGVGSRVARAGRAPRAGAPLALSLLAHWRRRAAARRVLYFLAAAAAAVDASPAARASGDGRSGGGARVRWLVPRPFTMARRRTYSRRLSGCASSSCACAARAHAPIIEHIAEMHAHAVEQLGVAMREATPPPSLPVALRTEDINLASAKRRAALRARVWSARCRAWTRTAQSGTARRLSRAGTRAPTTKRGRLRPRVPLRHRRSPRSRGRQRRSPRAATTRCRPWCQPRRRTRRARAPRARRRPAAQALARAPRHQRLQAFAIQSTAPTRVHAPSRCANISA